MTDAHSSDAEVEEEEEQSAGLDMTDAHSSDAEVEEEEVQSAGLDMTDTHSSVAEVEEEEEQSAGLDMTDVHSSDAEVEEEEEGKLADDPSSRIRLVRSCTLVQSKHWEVPAVVTRRKRCVARSKCNSHSSLHAPEISPPRGTYDNDTDISNRMTDWSYLYAECAEHRLANRPGARKKDCVAKQKHATWIMEDFMSEDTLVYAHHLLADASTEISDICDSMSIGVNGGWTVLHNNESVNDCKRLAANYSMRHNPRLKDLIMNYVFLVKEDGGAGKDAYPCGGSGEEFSITLLIALVNAMRQQEHTDYNPDYFRVYEDHEDVDEEMHTSHQNFNGASMFINFSWNNDHKLDLGEFNKKTGLFNYLPLPAMSIVIITGDLLHAGSANMSGAITRKFFLYLDPHPLCRNLGTFKQKGKLVKDNFIYFGSCAAHDVK
jgi:hypothetical protein